MNIIIDVKKLGVDMLSASAHKFNGPKGIGFLYVKKGTDLRPFHDGGTQEHGMRAGTENVASIVGMAVALKNNCDLLEKHQKHAGFIRREIEIIDPDIVAIVGTNLYDMGLHKSFLGALSSNGNCYFDLNGKKVPILSLWQTSYYQGKNEPLAGYEDNRTIGKQAERCINELKRFGLR